MPPDEVVASVAAVVFRSSATAVFDAVLRSMMTVANYGPLLHAPAASSWQASPGGRASLIISQINIKVVGHSGTAQCCGDVWQNRGDTRSLVKISYHHRGLRNVEIF